MQEAIALNDGKMPVATKGRKLSSKYNDKKDDHTKIRKQHVNVEKKDDLLWGEKGEEILSRDGVDASTSTY